MKKIKRIKKIERSALYLGEMVIEFFQSHVKTVLPFVRGVNIIYGVTDVGKSAIGRGFEALAFNRWPRDFRTGYKKPTLISGKIGNKRVVRTKSSTKNYFEIYDGDVIDEKLDVVDKYKVPNKVRNILNFSDINFQGQDDSPYLIGDTAGSVAKTINRITRWEDLDEWVTELTSRINNLKVDPIKGLERYKGDYSVLLRELELYEGLDDIGESVESVVSRGNKLEKLQNTYSKVDTILRNVERIDDILKDYEGLPDLEKEIQDVFAKWRDLKDLTEEQGILQGIIDDIELTDTQLVKLQHYISYGEEIDKLLVVTKSIIADQKKYNSVESLISHVENADHRLGVLDDEKKIHEKKYDDFLRTIKVCPFCGGKVSKEEIERHLNN